jgi:hypothetical protein
MFTIGSQLTLDPKQFLTGITSASSSVTSWATSTVNATSKASKSFGNTDKSVTKTASTIQGLNNRVKELSRALEKTDVGSKRFQVLSKGVADARAQLDAARKSTQSYAQAGQAAISSVRRQAMVLAGLTAAALANAKATANKRDELTKLGRTLGITTEEMSELAYAAKLSGIEHKDLKKNIGLLVNPTKQMTESLEQYGIQLVDSTGKTRNKMDVLRDISRTMATYSTDAEKAAMASRIFGNEGAKMVNLLGSGPEVLRELADEAWRLGEAFTNEQGIAAEKFNDDLERVTSSFAGLSSAFGDLTIEWANGNGILDELAKGIQFATALIKDFTSNSDNASKSMMTAVTAGTAITGTIYGIGTALTRTGAIAKVQWLSILGPLGLGITAMVFTIDYVIRERRETDQSRNQNNIKDLEKSMKQLNLSTDDVRKSINIVYDQLKKGDITASQASNTLNSLGQSWGIVNLQTRNMSRNQIDTHISSINSALEEMDNKSQAASASTQSFSDRMDALGKAISRNSKATKTKTSDNLTLVKANQKVAASTAESTGALTEAEQVIFSTNEQFARMVQSMDSGTSSLNSFIAGAKLAHQAIGQLGNAMTGFLNTSAQLAQAKFANIQQNVAFTASAINHIIDSNLRRMTERADLELQIISDKLKNIESREKEHLERSQSNYRRWLDERKRLWEEFVNGRIEIDEQVFQEESRKLEEDMYRRKEALLAQNNDEVTQALIRDRMLQELADRREMLREDLANKRKIELEEEKAKRDEEEQAETEKLEAEKAEREEQAEAEKEALIARQEEIEAEKLRVQEESNAKREQMERMMKLYEWQAGKASFKAQQQANVATAMMGGAQAVTQGAITAASIMAGYWAAAAALAAPTLGVSMATVGPMGMVLGPTVGGLVAATGIATSAKAVKAAQTPKYPPPPVFRKGGWVGGHKHELGGTMIEAELDEFVVNAEASNRNPRLLEAINEGADLERAMSQPRSINIQNLHIYEPASGRAVLDEIDRELSWREEHSVA